MIVSCRLMRLQNHIAGGRTSVEMSDVMAVASQVLKKNTLTKIHLRFVKGIKRKRQGTSK